MFFAILHHVTRGTSSVIASKGICLPQLFSKQMNEGARDLERVLYVLRPVDRRDHSKRNYEKLRRIQFNLSTITLFLRLPLLLSGGDQSLNPGQSTMIWMIVTEKEKILSL